MNSLTAQFIDRGRKLASGPIARDSIASLSIRITGLILTFVVSVLAARLLGVEGFGLASVAISAAQIGAAFALFGYNSLAIREMARRIGSGENTALPNFVKHAARMVVGLSVIAGLILAGFAISGPDSIAQYRPALLSAAVILPGLAAVQLCRGIAQGMGDVKAAQWPGELLRPAAMTAILLAIAFSGTAIAPPGYLIITAVIALFAALIASISIGRKLIEIGADSASDRTSADATPAAWRKQALPLFGLSLVAALQSEIAIIMLSLFAAPEQAGLFQPIARFIPLMALPVQAASMRAAPRIAEMWEAGEHARLQSTICNFTTATTLISLAITLPLALAGPWILSAFGPEFVASAPLLWIVAAAQMVNVGCGPVGYLLTMTNHSSTALQCQLTGLIVILIAGATLIPMTGALGAAIAVALGIAAWNLLLVAAVKRKLAIKPTILGTLSD